MDLEIAIFIIFSTILGIFIYTDIKHRKIYNYVVLYGVIFALAVSVWGGFIVSALIGGGLIFGTLVVARLISRSGVGPGDCFVGLVIGLMLGYPVALIVMFVGAVAGSLAAGTLQMMKKANTNTKLPLGAYLAATAIVFLFIGLL